VCDQNYMLPLATSIATPELGSRALHYADDIGLSDNQLRQILALAAEWRTVYLTHIRQVIDLGRQIDRLLLERDIGASVDELIERRINVMSELDHEFIQRWHAISDVLTDENDRRLKQVYLQEIEGLPHTVLGSTAPGGAPLSVAVGRRVRARVDNGKAWSDSAGT
jgi:hypothetical protein